MHTFCAANTLTDKALSVPLLGNSRDRFNAFSSIVFLYSHEHLLCETFKRSASCICGRINFSEEE
jgi:hypothetical protein